MALNVAATGCETETLRDGEEGTLLPKTGEGAITTDDTPDDDNSASGNIDIDWEGSLLPTLCLS